MEHARLSIVFMLLSMLIALANLATDITRLMLELMPPGAAVESIPTQPRQQETSRSAPDTREPDTAKKKVEALGVFGARGPPLRLRESGTGRPPFSPLPPDFSINCPPWRLVCRQPMHRIFDRRRFYDS
jgi:hypothetical protein